MRDELEALVWDTRKGEKKKRNRGRGKKARMYYAFRNASRGPAQFISKERILSDPHSPRFPEKKSNLPSKNRERSVATYCGLSPDQEVHTG